MAALGNAPTIGSSRAQPSGAKPAVQRAAQRFLNKASGKMETAQQMHGYRAPAPVPQGHNVSSTTHTVTREATRTPQAPVSFINKTPAEVEATARQLTNAEVSGIRSAYQPQNQLLGQEQTSALAGHATSYGQLQSTLGGLQSQQAGTAKTFENYAADALSKASTAAPGAAQTAEHLGLKPGEALPESAQRQQEAARTLLSGIAQAGAAGTNARQQNEASFLTNMQGTAALGNTEGARNIEGAFGRQKQEVLNKEGAAIGKAQGNQASLSQKLFGEQEKLRIAAQGLNYKGQETANKTAATTSKITNEAAKTKQAATNATNLNNYRNATLSEKSKQNEIKNRQAQERITATAEKNSKGKPVSPSVLKTLSAQLGEAFTTFERLRTPDKKGSRVEYGEINQTLTQGSEPGTKTPHLYKGKVVAYSEGKNIKVSKVGDAVLRRAAEQAWRYHNIDNQTMAQLASKGLPFTSVKEAYETIAGRPYTPAVSEITGHAQNTVVKKK